MKGDAILRTSLLLGLLLAGCLHLEVRAQSEARGDGNQYRAIPGGSFHSTLSGPPDYADVVVPPFMMRTDVVTNAEFQAFVQRNPAWQRTHIPSIFADKSYLQQWRADDILGEHALPDQPVTHVSWFAAQAYCESEGARLPSWHEWELVAAADDARFDARKDPRWLATILSWYGRNSAAAIGKVGGVPNAYGIRDMHGLVWEWVDDFNALLVSADSRNQGDPDKLKFCGAGAISLQDRENYAVLMRVALLSSLAGSDTTGNLGFRCVRPHQPK